MKALPTLDSSISFTIFQIAWSYVWAIKHIDIRKNRDYSTHRTLADTNQRYKVLSFFLFTTQTVLTIATFWSNSPLLLKLHDSDTFRILGSVMILAATMFYFWSLKHLGNNYSPCYDSHMPDDLVISGPYRFIRHPMYLAKLLLCFGTFILNGSLWWLIPCIYLTFDMARSIRKEEAYLLKSFPKYNPYSKRTKIIIPFIL